METAPSTVTQGSAPESTVADGASQERWASAAGATARAMTAATAVRIAIDMMQGLRRVQGLGVTLIAPSSAVPAAEAGLAPALAGQENGTRTVSRPPTSRAVSTTKLYWPGATPLICCAVKTSWCLPGALVG